MEIVVNIPDEFAAQVQAIGLTPESYLRSLVDDAMRAAPPSPDQAGRKMKIAEFLESMAAHSEKIPQLSDAAFTRESFYREHD